MTAENRPYIEEGHNKFIEGIPGDSDALFTLGYMVLSNGDIGLQMHNSPDTVNEDDFFYIYPVKFRTFFGGSPAPFIAEELSGIWTAFKEHDGKIPPQQGIRTSHSTDRIAGYYAITVEENIDDDKPRYKITGLYDQDTATDEKPHTLVDIEISQAGDATLRMTDTHTNRSGEMLFKSKKNNGQNPILAHVLNRVAERIAAAKRNR